jgi:hypothetical protein
MRTPEERAAERAAKRAAKEEARRLAATTRHLELPVSPDEALTLLKEAADLRTPRMRLLDYTADDAVVSVPGTYFGAWGTGGNVGAALSLSGRRYGVKLSWAPFGAGTQYTAYAPSLGAMFVLRTEIYSLFNALTDAWDARERWKAKSHP